MPALPRRITRISPAPRWETPLPPGVAGTYGPRVRAWAARELGVILDGWQGYAVDQVMRHDERGDFIARVALLSTARQNGKSVIVRAIVGWMLDEGQDLAPFKGWTTILLAAHDAAQARIPYRYIGQDIEGNKRLKAVSRVTRYFGIERGRIELDVASNQPGSVRGRSAGLIPWDEMLTQTDWDMWEALAPTQSAQRSPLMLLTSTAGHGDSVVLRAFYDRLVRQATGDERPDSSFYGAWWASEDIEAELDWRQIRQANPALDKRIPRAAIRTEHAILPPASWRRERLNHWVGETADTVFRPGAWAKLRTPMPLLDVDPPFTVGVHVGPQWERATVCVAALRSDGRIGLEVYAELREGITARRLIEIITGFPKWRQAVYFDAAGGPAAEFARAAQDDWGPEWIAMRPTDLVAGSMDFTELVYSGRIAVDDPLLDAQIGWAAKREVGGEGAFRFSQSQSGGPIDAVLAAMMAVHGAASTVPMPSVR